MLKLKIMKRSTYNILDAKIKNQKDSLENLGELLKSQKKHISQLEKELIEKTLAFNQLHGDNIEKIKLNAELKIANKTLTNSLTAAESALIEKDEKIKRYSDFISDIRTMIFQIQGKKDI